MEYEQPRLMTHLGGLFAWEQGETFFPVTVEISPSAQCNQRCALMKCFSIFPPPAGSRTLYGEGRSMPSTAMAIFQNPFSTNSQCPWHRRYPAGFAGVFPLPRMEPPMGMDMQHLRYPDWAEAIIYAPHSPMAGGTGSLLRHSGTNFERPEPIRKI